MKIIRHKRLRSYVDERLKDDWSPEEIAGRLQQIDTHLPYISRKAFINMSLHHMEHVSGYI